MIADTVSEPLAEYAQSATAFDRFVLKVVLGIGAVQIARIAVNSSKTPQAA
jgi:hypothetical protein